VLLDYISLVKKRGSIAKKLPIVVGNARKGKHRRQVSHRARMHHKQEAENLTCLLDASSPRYCFTGAHQPPANSPEASGRDVILSYRVAVADARACEWETGRGGSLRWSGSSFSKMPHPWNHRAKTSITGEICNQTIAYSTLVCGVVCVTITCAYSM
jgi:hypothetical protein